MTMKPKYLSVPENEKVKRWYENLEAKSVLTATVHLRTLGYYCELDNTYPEALLQGGGERFIPEQIFRFHQWDGKEGQAWKLSDTVQKGSELLVSLQRHRRFSDASCEHEGRTRIPDRCKREDPDKGGALHDNQEIFGPRKSADIPDGILRPQVRIPWQL